MKTNYKSTLYACYLGYVTQAIVNNLAPLLFVIFQNQFGISFEMIGRLILLNFVSQIIVDIIAVKYVDKIGYRRAAVMAHFFSTLGLICLGVLPVIMDSPYMGLTISVIIYAIGGGLIEVLISPIVESLPGDAKSSAMSLLHSFYCWGQMAVVFVTTILLTIIGKKYWFILPVFWALIPLFNMFKFIKVPLMPMISHEEKIPLKKLFSSKFFIIIIVLMVCAGASEQAMAQWASLFAEKGLGVNKVMGDLLGPCLFALFMGIGRTAYGIMGEKIDLKKALLGSAVLCLVCYLTAVFSGNQIIALFGCALTGLSVSLMWPGMLSLSARYFPRGGTPMFGVLAVFGDLGCSVGPWLTGAVSDFSGKSKTILGLVTRYGLNSGQSGLKTGLLAAMIFPALLFIGVSALKRESTILDK